MKESDIEEVLSRGVGAFVDPDNTFRDKLIKKANGEYPEDIVIKLGVDPTRPDIHLGHAVILRRLRQFQELGCKVIFLIGDFTALIGDPSGKSKVRPELEFKEIQENMKTFIDQVGKILRTDEKVFSWIINSDWFTNITDIATDKVLNLKLDDKPLDPGSFIGKTVLYENSRMQKTHLKKRVIHNVTLNQFLSTLRHITHSRLIARDLFQDRLNSGGELYMHEMMYPVLQGIDSMILARIYGSCDLEIGGTDQTFNMLMGRDVMRMSKLPEQAVLALNILPGTDGVEKMSKSLDNYIAITESPNEIFGKVMSLPDGLMTQYFTLATYTPLKEVLELETKLSNGKLHPRDLKQRLAREIVTIYHGEEAAKRSEENFIETFSKGGVPEDILRVTAKNGTKISLIVLENKLIDSKTEWKRLVDEGAVTNTEDGTKLGLNDTLEKEVTLKIGKRRFIKISPEK
ncbi:MAG: tyrosine--tRNA ligase [bacterium]|nr:tyrosine--tRNA ligase [bacterium]